MSGPKLPTQALTITTSRHQPFTSTTGRRRPHAGTTCTPKPISFHLAILYELRRNPPSGRRLECLETRTKDEEMLQMAMIDWHDFFVVDTINFADDEDKDTLSNDT
ncbi:probable splicing factor 3A subunit 1 [Olea europaea subsp. europaea]|uniref:Probable splicing factor 3A subunit 1 n=1 Tax=Olea europaea subsp. europaea TaxID=158383 RepID=A0A8S0RQN0_OLEEU|nr:probable splicing factor 3A subunit 1 [Olea europaea subsp. europaea]